MIEMNVGKNKGRKQKKLIGGVIVGIAAGLVVALGLVAAVLFLGGTGAIPEDRIDRIVEYGTVAQGVSINGIDISRMTKEQAYEATKGIEEDLLSAAVFEMDVDGEVTELDASYFGLYTDYSDAIEQALGYGRTGSFDDRQTQLGMANGTGIDLDAKVCADEATVSAAAQLFKSENDVAAFSAGYEFMPWGYIEADGTAYEPDVDEYITTISKKKEFVYMQGLITIAEEDMPALVRYQYYVAKYYYRDKNDGEVYIPKDANTARFKYTEESKGIDIDAQGLSALILTAVENAQFGSIEVLVKFTHTDTAVEEAMYDTQLLSSWTSYLSHSDTSRMYNVAKLSSIINGVVIQPGEAWSINDESGARTFASGWQAAPGYTDGVSVDQAGGGVCQISSTIYNAMLRAGLEFSDDISSRRHSTVSDYIPIGLDATISTPYPDLVITNPYDYPLYIVSYMNGKEKNVTVEFYGRPLTDENGKELIFDFSSKELSPGSEPTVVYVYGTAQTPSPTNIAVPEGGYVEVGHTQAKRNAEVYRTMYDIDGKVVEEKTLYYSHTYPQKTMKIYCNFPQPVDMTNPLVPTPPEIPEEPDAGEAGDYVAATDGGATDGT